MKKLIAMDCNEKYTYWVFKDTEATDWRENCFIARTENKTGDMFILKSKHTEYSVFYTLRERVTGSRAKPRRAYREECKRRVIAGV